jgi:hypothetical protein
MSTDPPEFLTVQTLGSLASTAAILGAAYGASVKLLPSSASTKLRTLYIWHLADGICHLTLEASFLYNCFFTYVQLPTPGGSDYVHPAAAGSVIGPGAGYALSPSPFLGRRDRAYGPAFGSNPTAVLWQEYAKADARWGRADLGVVALEILTVFLAGPIALWVSELIRQGAGQPGGKGGAKSASMWFWAVVLATGELYGGFMTFAPEWLSANENLRTDHFMYLLVSISLEVFGQ